jgi:hypothetical protein
MGKLRLLKKTTWEHCYMGMATTTIRSDDLRKFIKQYHKALGGFYGWRIADLYVGRKYFAELMRLNAPHPDVGDWGVDLSVDVPSVYVERLPLDQIQYHGVRVHLVPWFEGILALPPNQSPGAVDVRLPDPKLEPVPGPVPGPVDEPKRQLYRRGWHN